MSPEYVAHATTHCGMGGSYMADPCPPCTSSEKDTFEFCGWNNFGILVWVSPHRHRHKNKLNRQLLSPRAAGLITVGAPGLQHAEAQGLAAQHPALRPSCARLLNGSACPRDHQLLHGGLDLRAQRQRQRVSVYISEPCDLARETFAFAGTFTTRTSCAWSTASCATAASWRRPGTASRSRSRTIRSSRIAGSWTTAGARTVYSR